MRRPGTIFDVMTNGFGAMYSYAARIEPEDRWRIAAYVRVLQAEPARDRRGRAGSGAAEAGAGAMSSDELHELAGANFGAIRARAALRILCGAIAA